MDASHPKQIDRVGAVPVWVWDGHWWPGVVADSPLASKHCIVRLENGRYFAGTVERDYSLAILRSKAATNHNVPFDKRRFD